MDMKVLGGGIGQGYGGYSISFSFKDTSKSEGILITSGVANVGQTGLDEMTLIGYKNQTYASFKTYRVKWTPSDSKTITIRESGQPTNYASRGSCELYA